MRIGNNYLLESEGIPEEWEYVMSALGRLSLSLTLEGNSTENAFQIMRKPKMMGYYQSTAN